jgi:regulator of protease activity HflC (stomatin/prohibitin superfamily)
LTVDSFVKWRVSDVAKYFTTTGGDEERLRSSCFWLAKLMGVKK